MLAICKDSVFSLKSSHFGLHSECPCWMMNWLYSYACFLWRTDIAKTSSFSSCIWYSIRYFPTRHDHKSLSFPFNCFPACGFYFNSLRPSTTLSCNVLSSREKSLSNLCDRRRLYFIPMFLQEILESDDFTSFNIL